MLQKVVQSGSLQSATKTTVVMKIMILIRICKSHFLWSEVKIRNFVLVRGEVFVSNTKAQRYFLFTNGYISLGDLTLKLSLPLLYTRDSEKVNVPRITPSVTAYIWGGGRQNEMSSCLTHAMKSYGWMQLQLHSFVTPLLDEAEWPAALSCRFTSGERAPGFRWIWNRVDTRACVDDLKYLGGTNFEFRSDDHLHLQSFLVNAHSLQVPTQFIMIVRDEE
jgi:hypothetical protein